MSEDDSVKHEGKWTRDDLPTLASVAPVAASVESYVYFASSMVLDAVVEHLNAHHPKPDADSFSDRVWKRAYESMRRERDAAVERADHAEKAAWRVRYQQAVADLLDAGGSRDEWKGRAEKAEADLEELSEEFADFRVEVVAEAVKHRELNPPVFDVDVERTIRAEFVEGGFRAKTPVEYRVVRAVCELFGVKAEPTEGQIEDVALIISAGMFHKEPSPELVREIAQEVVDYFKEENDG